MSSSRAPAFIKSHGRQQVIPGRRRIELQRPIFRSAPCIYVHQIRLDFNLPSSNLDLFPRIRLSLRLLVRVIHCVGRGSFQPPAGPRLTNAQEGDDANDGGRNWRK
jgi:hypothetical protein